MDISLIICTQNRSASLSLLFRNLEKLLLPPNCRWEILLVDNASTDDTSERIRAEISRRKLPLRHLIEPVKGKSKALNLALKHATGQLIIFTDDDLDFSQNWLLAYWQASEVYPNINGFMGKVLPIWEKGRPPSWIESETNPSPVDGIIGHRDHGTERILLDNGSIPAGCNGAIRKNILPEIGKFREDIGPGTRFPFAEDTDFFRRIPLYLYVPEALVFHRNAPKRLSRSYFLKWIFNSARSEAQIHSSQGMRTWLGIPLYLFRELGVNVLQMFLVFSKRYLVTKFRPVVRTMGEITGHCQKKLLKRTF